MGDAKSVFRTGTRSRRSNGIQIGLHRALLSKKRTLFVINHGMDTRVQPLLLSQQSRMDNIAFVGYSKIICIVRVEYMELQMVAVLIRMDGMNAYHLYQNAPEKMIDMKVDLKKMEIWYMEVDDGEKRVVKVACIIIDILFKSRRFLLRGLVKIKNEQNSNINSA